ncbi:MAG: TolC family protein [Synechococcaceae bacterium WB7_1C_051]|nr:TolC family protein [Synechococcaceae bacterium WB7_1C_051]
MNFVKFTFGSLFVFTLSLTAKAVPIGNHTIPNYVQPSHAKDEAIVPVKPEPAISITEKLKKYRQQLKDNSISKTLGECLELGIRQNKLLAASYASIQEQEYSLIGIKRQFLPSLNLTSLPPFLGSVKTRSSETQFQQVIVNPNGTTQITNNKLSSLSTNTYNQFAPYFTLTWSFFQPALPASINAAAAQVQKQRLAFDVTARSAVLQIQQAYYTLQANKALIDSFERIYRINLDQLNYIQERQRAGLTNIGAVEQARTQLYAQLNQLISFYEKYFQASASLSLSLNQPGDMIVLPTDKLEQAALWPNSLQQTVSEALILREEIQSYLQSEQASIWNARSAIRQYLPVLSLQGIYYGIFNKGSADSLVNYESKYDFNSIGLGISWNIFDGGVAAAQAKSLEAAAKNSRNEAEYYQFVVRSQVQRTYSTYEMSQLSLESANANLLAANNTLKANRARFNIGLADITSLVQSMQLLGQAEEAQISALQSYNQSVAELYRYSARWPSGISLLVDQQKRVLQKQ